MSYIVKKTIVDAVQYNDINDVIAFAPDRILATQESVPQYFLRATAGIKALLPGMWVICDTEGKYTVMDNDAFTAMYEGNV